MLVRYMDVINMCASQVRAAAHVAADIEDSANRSFCATHPMAVLVQLRAHGEVREIESNADIREVGKSFATKNSAVGKNSTAGSSS